MNVDRKHADEEIIGQTFAMLCGDKHSKDLCCYGESVFRTTLEHYKEIADSVNFN